MYKNNIYFSQLKMFELIVINIPKGHCSKFFGSPLNLLQEQAHEILPKNCHQLVKIFQFTFPIKFVYPVFILEYA